MTMAQTDLFIDSKVEEITPQQAALWLEGANTHNRPMKYDRAVALAGAITRGEWVLNGDALRFCTNGQLLDGQHRLQAIVIAGKPVQSLVVRGLPPSSFTTIDTNRVLRTPRDVVALAGVANYNIVAPAARLLGNWSLYGNPYELSQDKTLTADVVLQYAQTPGLAELAQKALAMRWCRKYLGSALTLFAMYAFGQYRPEHAEKFFSKLETGLGLEEGSPIPLLRDRMTVTNVGYGRMTPTTRAILLFKCWRLYLLGVNSRQLKVVIQKGQPLREHFVMEKRNEGPHDAK